MGQAAMPGMQMFVFSRSLAPRKDPDVTIVGDDAEKVVDRLRRKTGKDIWLFGGGSLFRSLLAAGLVDSVEVAIVPILLGDGIPLLPQFSKRTGLKLIKHRVYKKTGITSLEYSVERGRGRRIGKK